MNGNALLVGDKLPFLLDVGETLGDFLGDFLVKDLVNLLGFGICTGDGLALVMSFNNGDSGLTSLKPGLGFGGDIFFDAAGGDGGGGAAFRAGIVIGDGTF